MMILFDVDGTLTPSRGTIDPAFKTWLQYELKHEFRLITGSDPAKTQEQIGLDFWNECYVYNCAGNYVFDQGREVYRSTWQIPSDLEWILKGKLFASPYPVKTGNHIEHRIGLCNYSTVGRNATVEERKAYYEWDKRYGERESLAKLINHCWPDIECTVAGETGIDIYKKGTGKDQILPQLVNDTPLHFFGDRQDPAGNDYQLAQVILTNGSGICYHVKNWQHTWQLLKELNEQ